ncbi:MAG: iron ABC transporter permease [Firmicutes bacterium]|nr:iron ABC transporter permease [Bacillota bacterium]
MRRLLTYNKLFGVLLLGIALAIIIASSLGAVRLPSSWIIKTLLGQGPEGPSYWHSIFWQIRLPRVLGAVLVGAVLALSGTAFQGVLKNSLADPYILGVSAGASLGAAIASLLSVQSVYGFSFAAFLGALAVTSIVYTLASNGMVRRVQDLVLAGVAIGSVASSLVSVILVLDRASMDKIVMWMMGSFSGISWSSVRMLFLCLIIGLLILNSKSRVLNALLLGEEAAWNLGINVTRETYIILTTASFLAAVAVSVTGVIGFVGLMVPHIIRLLIGPDHKYLLPASVLGGGLLVVITDCLARTIIAPTELPVGVITSLLGGPFFLYLLKTNKKKL